MRAQVFGIGQAAAGDDGVGIEVLRELRRRAPEGGAPELVELADPMSLVPHLEEAGLAVLVDAVVSPGPPGRVLRLRAEEAAAAHLALVSTHGITVLDAFEVARALGASARRVVLVGITIEPPSRYHVGLSREVLDAVPRAADEVLSVLRELSGEERGEESGQQGGEESAR